MKLRTLLATAMFFSLSAIGSDNLSTYKDWFSGTTPKGDWVTLTESINYSNLLLGVRCQENAFYFTLQAKDELFNKGESVIMKYQVDSEPVVTIEGYVRDSMHIAFGETQQKRLDLAVDMATGVSFKLEYKEQSGRTIYPIFSLMGASKSITKVINYCEMKDKGFVEPQGFIDPAGYKANEDSF